MGTVLTIFLFVSLILSLALSYLPSLFLSLTLYGAVQLFNSDKWTLFAVHRPASIQTALNENIPQTCMIKCKKPFLGSYRKIGEMEKIMKVKI